MSRLQHSKGQSLSGSRAQRSYSLGMQELMMSQHASSGATRDIDTTNEKDGKSRLLIPVRWRQKRNSVAVTSGNSSRKSLCSLNTVHLLDNAKFKRVARLTVWCVRLASQYYRTRLEDLSPYVTEIKFHDCHAAEKDTPLLFDPSVFRADRQLRIPTDVAKILRCPQELRTEEQCHYALVALRNIKAIAEYPERMQRSIAEVGQYERYDAKRVIVRQGRPASSFYFILSGSVVVLVTEIGSRMARPVAYLPKAPSILRPTALTIVNQESTISPVLLAKSEELAIINRTNRQSTIVAKETVELLSIDIKDFHRIFMSGGVKNVNDPDHNDFLKRGDILVQDSDFSPWIYIVKSGSVLVLKKLHKVTNVNGRSRMNGNVKRRFKTETKKERTPKSMRYPLTEINLPLRSPADDSREESFQHPGLANNNGRRQMIVRRSAGSDFIPLALEPNLNCKDKTELRKQTPSDEKSSAHQNNEYRRQRKPPNRGISFQDAEEEFFRDMRGRKQEIRTITQDLDAPCKNKATNDAIQTDENVQVIRVETLVKGQAFGVAHTVLGGQPSLCLVSSGAECVMLDRTFYLQHAPTDLISKLRQECCPYPADETLQQALQEQVEWQAFKTVTVQSLMRNLAEIRALRKTMK